MAIFYLIPAAVLWVIYGIAWLLGAPWWIEYPLFGISCAVTAIGVMIAMLTLPR